LTLPVCEAWMLKLPKRLAMILHLYKVSLE